MNVCFPLESAIGNVFHPTSPIAAPGQKQKPGNRWTPVRHSMAKQ